MPRPSEILMRHLLLAILKDYELMAERRYPPPEYEDLDEERWEGMQKLVKSRPEDAWVLILRLVELALEKHLTHIGVGPVEDIIDFHGERFIDRIESECRRNPNLLDALSVVQLGPWVKEPVVRRVQRLTPSAPVGKNIEAPPRAPLRSPRHQPADSPGLSGPPLHTGSGHRDGRGPTTPQGPRHGP